MNSRIAFSSSWSFFGKGPYELTLRRLAGMLQLNQVHFRGHVSNIETVWEQNHMLVLPCAMKDFPWP
jgi:hypothetical protein